MHLPLTMPFSKKTMPSGGPRPRRLRKLDGTGSNPGNLTAWFFTPEEKAGLPLVVVLHGCTQTASAYDQGSGWSDLAETYGFAVLFPEQQRANNANLCFNWFEPKDTARGGGETLSIAQMVDAMADRHGIDRQRVFITGLSAGGAMTAVMLARYPEKFAGGAVLAGLPHGAAASIPEAFQQMRAPTQVARSAGSSIKREAAHAGAWPAIAIWHGSADTVVNPTNADAIVRQWREVHGLSERPTEVKRVDGHPYRAWKDSSGKVLVEEYRVTGMGHGTPLATGGECGCGEAGAFMLEVGISSTVHSARSWGLLGTRSTRTAAAANAPDQKPPWAQVEDAHAQPANRITHVIEQALRSAGLMK